MNEAYMLTTLDNPFNPFIEFSDWKRFDEDHNYYTCALLDRLTFTSNNLSDEENTELLNVQIQDIIDDDETANLMKVRKDTKILAKG